jgi:hypothetical protein
MTTAIEEQLRQRLAELADDAPATMHLTGITTRVATRRHRRAAVRGTLVGLAVTGVATGLYGGSIADRKRCRAPGEPAGPSG